MKRINFIHLRYPIHAKGAFSRIVTLLFSVICSFGITTSSLLANPTGGEVVAGSATITTPTPNTVQINQATDKAILNWQSFNIGAGETTQFIQPSSGSVALNRINPNQGASQIFGHLTSNGQIVLINQAGIFFASGSHVDVGGIIASTRDMTNQNFMAGNYVFDQPSLFSGSIINQGTIIAAKNGLVALIGSGVSNEGLIIANLGTVILAAGNRFTITFSDDNMISFIVDGDAMSAGVNQQGEALKNGVSNSGQITANGGRILIIAKTASDTLDHAINMVGVLQAQSVSEKNGEIILSANGSVLVTGKLDVSGKQGGKIKILGTSVYLASAVLNANGITKGGEILIGGNFQGAGPEANALTTTIDSDTLIEANALQEGNGGTVIVWSNEITNYGGHISATGGAAGGDGGFVEVSGHQLLSFHGTVDLSAAAGSTGTLLLDPENLTIQTAGPTTATNASGTYTSNVDNSILTVIDLQTALANANVLVQTGSGGLQAGDITVADSVTWNNSNSLTLSAFHNINMNAAITNSSGGSLVLKADNTGTGSGTILFSGATPQINMSGGGTVNFYYNPTTFPTPTNFSSNVTVSGGTTFTPYMLVNNLTNLQNMNNNLSGNYALGKAIDASPTSVWNAGAGFVPVGTSAANFTGQFDGQNYTIDGLTIFLPIASSVGLFGYVNSTGVIQNVGLTNVAITGLINVGALIGFDAAGTVNNAYSTGTVTSDASSSNVGGLIGFSGGNISNSYSTATVLAGATSNYIGGLVGQAGASISNSYHVTGSVTAGATSTYVGGLAGYSLGSVSHSYNTGAVSIGATGSANLGGLIGYSVGSVSDSYSTGSVTAGAAVTNVGGLIGYGFGTVSTSYSTGAIVTGATGSANIGGLVGFANSNVSNSYSHSSILGGAANTNVGGLVGQNNATVSNSYSTGNVAAGAGSTFLGDLVGLNNSFVTNSFWDTQTSGQLASAGGTGKTTAEMMQQTTFCPSGNCSGDPTHFDFATNWGIINGLTYPYLQTLTQSVSGQVFSSMSSGVPVANNVISLVSAGVVLSGLAISQSQSTSDSNGFYYFLLNNSYLSQTNPLLAFVSAGTTVGNTLFSLTPAAITANIYGNTISNQGSGVLSNTLLASTKGGISDPGILYSAIGSNLTLGNATNTTADFFTAIETPYTINGNITPISGGSNSFTFNGPVTVSGNSIVLAGETFTNNAVTFTLNAGGTFLVWSGDPADDNRGGIAYDFKQYNAIFGTTPVLGTGTGFLYTLAPVISPSLIGAVTKSYDTTTTATLTSGNYANTGAVDGDTVTLNNPTLGVYDTKNVGSNKNVSVSGLSIASATDGSAIVYGYQLSSTTANANIGSITPATLTYNATSGSMTYGSAIPLLTGTVTGFMGGESQATATTGTLGFTTLATSSSNAGDYAIDGSGLTANNGNYVFVQAPANATALTITVVTVVPPPGIVPVVVNNVTPPSTGLIDEIISATSRDDFIPTNNGGLTNISIINNTNFMASNNNITIEGAVINNAVSTIFNSAALSRYYVQNGFFNFGLESQNVVLKNLISLQNNEIRYPIESILLASLAILLALLLASRWLYLIWDRDDEDDKTKTPDPYQGIVVANGVDIGNLLKGTHAADYTVTTNFIFTGRRWVETSRYSESSDTSIEA